MRPVLANVAVPIFFPHPIIALLALIPMVAVETLVLKSRLGLDKRNVFKANLISGILGCVFAFVCVVSLGSFNIFLTREGTTLANLLLMLGGVVFPCFVISVIVEGAYLRSTTEAVEARGFWYAIIKAHVYSYLVLIALDCIWLSYRIW